MKFRLLDATGDWMFGAGMQSYAKDLPALLLDLKTRILSWVGDCFFDLDAGIDWKNMLDYNTKDRLQSALKALAFRTAGVIRVNSVEITINAPRTALIEMSVDTVYGSNVSNAITLGV